MSLPLTAPSSVRRSKKRCAQYVETNQTVASALETDEGWIDARSWYAADICIREIKADPDYQAAKDFFRFNIGGIV